MRKLLPGLRVVCRLIEFQRTQARRMMPGLSAQLGQQTVLLWQDEGRLLHHLPPSHLPPTIAGFVSLKLTIGTDFAWRAAQHSKVFSAQGVK